jgi:hypothetical protein
LTLATVAAAHVLGSLPSGIVPKFTQDERSVGTLIFVWVADATLMSRKAACNAPA